MKQKKTEDDSYLIKNHQEEYEKFFEINESEYFGTTASISINSDDTNVYLQPNPNSKVLGTLREENNFYNCFMGTKYSASSALKEETKNGMVEYSADNLRKFAYAPTDHYEKRNRQFSCIFPK